MTPVNSISSNKSFIDSMNAPSTTPIPTRLDDQFMQLLMVELRNQNPMEPMKSDEMVAQMAQLNSLNELQNISKALKELGRTNQFLSASNLIGKRITYMVDDQSKEGLVESFELDGDTVSLSVGNNLVSLDDVLSVREG